MAVQGIVDWKGNPINKNKHGGSRAARFIYFMVVMMNVTYSSNVLNMVTYLRGTMHMDVATSSTTMTNFIGVSCAFALVGGFLSDSYITRFKTIIIFGPLEFLGFGLLALQAHLPSLQPPACDISTQFSNCKQVQSYNAALLYIALYITAFGEGCLRANLASFGGDQFDDDEPTELQLKSSFFNWFTFSISLGALIGLTFFVWIQDNKGWDVGFTVSAGFILLGVLVVASGFSFFRHQIPTGSPLTRMLQVLITAFQKRKLQFPENEEELFLEHNKEEKVGEVLLHTEGFRWLDKAIISNKKIENWYLCTVSQVEEMKIVLRMIPIFISVTIGYIPIRLLLTFTVEQGSTMNTKVGGIHIPPASLVVIPTIFQMVILVAYDRWFVPLARRITRCPTGITPLQRAGVGFIAASLASCIGALIERKRRSIAEKHGLLDSGNTVPMSVIWLLLQFLAICINDVFTPVGLLQFFNTEVSRGMKSLGTAFFWCILGLSSLMGSVLVNVVNRATKNGEIGWLEGNNLNRNYLDRFYWLLSILGLLAFLNYLYWARRYQYRQHNLAPTS
ncbi:Proton-dependent oligopeptide transporter family [Macleaya cordata]|uniref:Proton-dependent oligopeptide transporter family n=1 Tax=Macleaya cordata TaxID=56857 RepID=A0A200Q2B8_MACCD|nr:Proton-dependent oligopeptide transporter family [Macleaya cordata]